MLPVERRAIIVGKDFIFYGDSLLPSPIATKEWDVEIEAERGLRDIIGPEKK